MYVLLYIIHTNTNQLYQPLQQKYGTNRRMVTCLVTPETSSFCHCSCRTHDGLGIYCRSEATTAHRTNQIGSFLAYAANRANTLSRNSCGSFPDTLAIEHQRKTLGGGGGIRRPIQIHVLRRSGAVNIVHM